MVAGSLVLWNACAIAEAPANWFTDKTDAEEECVRRNLEPADLLTLREVGGMTGTGLSVSPDGRYLAFEAHQADVENNNYNVGWFIAQTTPHGEPVYVGSGGDATLFRNALPDGRVVGAWIAPYAQWSPDSKGIAYRKQVDGAIQIWWSTTRGPEQLTHNSADVTDFHWSKDGSKIYFATGETRTRLRSISESRFRMGHVYDYERDWSTIDGQPYYPPYESIGGEPRLWVLERTTRLERSATKEELEEFEERRESGRNSENQDNRRFVTTSGDKIGTAWLQPADPAKQGMDPPMTLYASVEASGEKPVRCLAEECTGSFDTERLLNGVLYWKTIDDDILFVRKEGAAYSRRTLYAWQPDTGRVRTVFSTDEWVSDCTVVVDRAICFRETPTYPRTIVSIDLDDGRVRTLVDPNPEFRCLRLGDVELMEWDNEKGYRTFGYLVTPPDLQPGVRYPLVFVGYRARLALRGGVGDEYPVHLLANAGFVVLVYEKPTEYAAQEVYADVLDIGRARWGKDLFDVTMPLASFEAAIDILAQRRLVDRHRVAITGLSNGAAHANYAIIHSELFAAGIVSSCEFSPTGRVLSGAAGPAMREYRRAIGAGPYPGPHGSIFPHISLSLNAAHVNTPLLVNVSDQEHPSALGEVVALIEAEKAVEMVVYSDEGHIKWHPAHRAAVYERNVDWLRFWLQDEEDSDHRKASRYSRWHDLREKIDVPRRRTEALD